MHWIQILDDESDAFMMLFLLEVMMKLFHVSDKSDESSKWFMPRIPVSVAESYGEDTKTPRICFATSVELCVQAAGYVLEPGNIITVYEFVINDSDKNLISPEQLFNTGKVMDALENQEYWYLKPAYLTAEHYVIKYVDISFELAWTCIKKSDVIKIAKDMMLSEKIPLCIIDLDAMSDGHEVYEFIMKELDARILDDESDAFYDAISELPWAQLSKVNELRLAKCEKAVSVRRPAKIIF